MITPRLVRSGPGLKWPRAASGPIQRWQVRGGRQVKKHPLRTHNTRAGRAQQATQEQRAERNSDPIRGSPSPRPSGNTEIHSNNSIQLRHRRPHLFHRHGVASSCSFLNTCPQNLSACTHFCYSKAKTAEYIDFNGD